MTAPPISVTRYWSKNLAQIDATAVFPLRIPFQTSSISHQCFWTTFVSKFVAKNFKKSPNLVTLENTQSSNRP